MRTTLLVALFTASLLAGCAGEPAGTEGATATDTGTDDPVPGDETQNAAPVVTATTDRDNGTIPFIVTFTIDATDADGDNLTWSLFEGDATLAVGVVPDALALNVTAAGEHLYRLVVTDGKAEAAQNFTVIAVEAVVEEPFQAVTLEQDILLSCAYCTLGPDYGESTCLAVITDDNGLDCAFWAIDHSWIGHEWVASGLFLPVIEYYTDCTGTEIIDFTLDGSGTIPEGTGCIVMYDPVDPVVTAKIVIS